MQSLRLSRNFFRYDMSIQYLNKIVQPKQLTDFWSKTIDCYKQADRPVKNYCLITLTGKRFINLNRAFFPWDYFLLFLRSSQQTKNMVIFGKNFFLKKLFSFKNQLHFYFSNSFYSTWRRQRHILTLVKQQLFGNMISWLLNPKYPGVNTVYYHSLI